MPKMVIVGGGKTGEQLMELMDNAKLIELDPDRAIELKKRFGEDRVIMGPGSSEEVLKKAEVDEKTTLIIATGNDQDNYKCARVAKEMGINKAVVRLRDEKNEEMFKKLGVKTMVLSELFVAGVMGAGIFPEVRSVTEVVIENESPLAGTPIGELELKNSIIIGGILRGDHMLSPSDDMVLLPGDVLSVITPGKITASAKDILMGNVKKNFKPMRVLGLIQDEQFAKKVLRTIIQIGKTVNRETTLATKSSLKSHVANLIEEEGVQEKIRLKVWEDKSFTKSIMRGARWEDYNLIVASTDKCGIFSFWKKSWLEAVMLDSHAPLLNPRDLPPYRKMFFLIDGSESSRRASDLGLRIAMSHEGKVDALVLDEENAKSDYIDLERKGKVYGVEAKKEIIEGNPTLEYIDRVRNGDYDLVVVNWNCKTVTRDLLRRVMLECGTSVLVVP